MDYDIELTTEDEALLAAYDEFQAEQNAAFEERAIRQARVRAEFIGHPCGSDFAF